MYYILTYDIASPKRLPKILKTCRKYLYWVQKSVFEGELTTAQAYRMKNEIKRIIDRKKDSVLIYEIRTPDVCDKRIIGIEKNEISTFL